jgi:hypothetical protein
MLLESSLLADTRESARYYSGIVKLHLVYYGPVKSSGNRPQTENKHQIRRALSNQIKAFVIKHLIDIQLVNGGMPKYAFGDHQFIPLVTRKLHLECDVEGVLLSPEPPSGKKTVRGDADGRRKTIIDALAMPTDNELKTLAPIDEPIYCLAEDDSLIDDSHIKPGILLAPFEEIPAGVPTWEHRKHDSLLMIGIEIGATFVNDNNKAFLSRR